MSFNNLTGMSSYKKDVARVFVRPKFTDSECDLIKTSSKVPSSGGYVQLFTYDGGAILTPKRTASKLYDQQRGDTDVVIDKDEYTLEITVAQISLPIMQDLLLLDPTIAVSAAVLDLKSNRGISITDKGVSFLVYDKSFDADNDGNTPLITADAEMWVIYKAVPSSNMPPIVKDNKQGTAKLTFDVLMSKSSGSSAGIAARIGAFTAA